MLGAAVDPRAIEAALNAEHKRSAQAAVVGRVGAAFDNLLVYGLGGIAFSEASLRYEGESRACFLGFLCAPPTSFDESDDQIHVGWTVGGGGEYAFSEHWSARLEARYTDFDEETYTFFDDDDQIDVDVDFDQISVTGGISYRF